MKAFEKMLKNEAYWVTAKFRKLHAKSVLQEIYQALNMNGTEFYQEEFKQEMAQVCQSLSPTLIPTPKTITAIAKAKQAGQSLDGINMELTERKPPTTFGYPFPQNIYSACEKMGHKFVIC